jgi:2-polyprenyl-3-methyl-5-hydroxy-6-metoxy-1,4-benzoquinol methylase
MNRQDWNAKYAAQDLVWGEEPNRFVAAELGDLSPRGRALDLACGEGRNAIWLAKLGWQVMAVDFSHVAIERARRLAARQGVTVEWACDDVARCDLPADAFRLVLIAYLQLPPADFETVLARAARALAPGGTLFMIGHALRNLKEGVGGPRQPDVLWQVQDIKRRVQALGLTVRRAEDVLRPVETPDGVREAIDALILAERGKLGSGADVGTAAVRSAE